MGTPTFFYFRLALQLVRGMRRKMRIKIEVFNDKECKDSVALHNKPFTIDVKSRYAVKPAPDGTYVADDCFVNKFEKKVQCEMSAKLDVGTSNRCDGYRERSGRSFGLVRAWDFPLAVGRGIC